MKQKALTPKEKKIRKKIHIKELVDTYSGLLTDKENEILSLYTEGDTTGAHIARKLNVSRQAVHDHIRRAVTRMENCERKMGKLEKNKKAFMYIDKLQKMLEKMMKEAPKHKEMVEKELRMLKKIEKNI